MSNYSRFPLQWKINMCYIKQRYMQVKYYPFHLVHAFVINSCTILYMSIHNSEIWFSWSLNYFVMKNRDNTHKHATFHHRINILVFTFKSTTLVKFCWSASLDNVADMFGLVSHMVPRVSSAEMPRNCRITCCFSPGTFSFPSDVFTL